MRGLVVRVLGEPGVVGGEVDLDADALGVVEDAGVGSDVAEGALGVGGVGRAEDGAEAGLFCCFDVSEMRFGVRINERRWFMIKEGCGVI